MIGQDQVKDRRPISRRQLTDDDWQINRLMTMMKSHRTKEKELLHQLVVDTLTHEGDLVDGVLGRLDVTEPADDSGMSGTLLGTFP